MAGTVVVDIPPALGGGSFDHDDDASVATTALASDVGSVMRRSKDAFLRSVTFYKDDEMEWGVKLADPPAKAKRKSRKPIIESVSGKVLTCSKLQPGDVLKSINGKRIGPSYNAMRAKELMDKCLEDEGVLSIAVGNDIGDDILIQVTVIKPRADMTYNEMGLTVWDWSGLCIREIEKDSIFSHTVLKESDYIETINDIAISKTTVTPEEFAHIVNNLPLEITIVVKRPKQRWTGRFG